MEQYPYQQIIESLTARFVSEGRVVTLRQASDEDIRWLRTMGVPKTIVSFFTIAEPNRWIDIEGIEIGPIAGLKSDNTEAVPGIAASRLGYIVIAKTISGDAYCVDTNAPSDEGQTPIYIVSHDKVWQSASKQEVEAGIKLITTSFADFLTRFITGDLPYDFDQAEDLASGTLE